MLYCDAITDAMVKGLGQQKTSVRYNIFTSVLDVVFLYILLPRYGIGGYFVSFLVTHLINFILSLRLLLKITVQRLPAYVPMLCVSAVGAGILLSSTLSGSAIRAVAFLAIFISLLTLFRILSKKDILWIKGLVNKK
jgi:stage V sporulation protein B